MKSIAVIGGAALAAVALATASESATATAPPVGALPPAQVVRQDVGHGALVALALPATRRGTVWRVARAFNGHVAAEVEERTLRSSTVVVFKAAAAGHTTITFALTAGETSPKALRAISLDLRVR